jgi:cyanate permease
MSAFLPSIVAELGYSGTEANLLTIPPYVCACLLTVLLSWLSDRLKVRSTFVLCLLAGEFVGYGLALDNSARGIHGLTYVGVFISVSCCYPCFILIVVS